MRHSIILTAAVVVGAGFLAFCGNAQSAEAVGTAVATAVTKATLNNEDCQKCHAAVVQQVAEKGSKHKTDVACLECHDGTHPPGVAKGSLIPKCTNCHTDKPHYKLEKCLSCHKNPHQPLNIVFGGNVKAACNTCHSEQVAEVDANPSAHSKVDCSFCHDKHRYKPDCLNCHDVHIENQKYVDCVKCHQVHQPRKLAYGKEIPNRDCGACHAELRKTLEAGTTKHAKFQCVFCHANKHGNVPKCESCHQAPHNAQMLSKFQSCNQCHQSAHNLLK